MIMGDTCTRACAFCDVKTGKPSALDIFEPLKISKAVKDLNFNYLTIHISSGLNALKAAVQEPSGTAYKLNFDNPNFVKIGGKTGTSQVVRIKEEDREDDLYKTKEIEDRFKDHSVFVGYAPIENPKYIVSVIIENGGSGSAVAAPIAHKILNFAYQENV